MSGYQPHLQHHDLELKRLISTLCDCGKINVGKAVANSTYDIITVGGGPTGTVVASRLHGRLPNFSILLVEAGLDVSKHPSVTDINKATHKAGSEIDWHFSTVARKRWNGRISPNNSGKGLRGASAFNG